jgi:hypothetical protein
MAVNVPCAGIHYAADHKSVKDVFRRKNELRRLGGRHQMISEGNSTRRGVGGNIL